MFVQSIMSFVIDIVIFGSVPEQFPSLICRLFVVEVLIVGQGLCGIEHVHHTAHVCVDQANEFEIANVRKADREELPFYLRAAVHARRTIEIRVVGGCAGTSHRERRPCLSGNQECDCMCLVGFNLPRDAIAGVNPNFIGKKTECLLPLIVTLRTHCGLPLSVAHLRKNKDDEQQQPAEPI
jgi:hypothetical protein